MATAHHPEDVAAFVDRLGSQATRRHGVPEGTTRSACSITVRKFESFGTLDDSVRRRVAAYFWGVVRRRALSAGSEVSSLRQRYVAATVEADMLEARTCCGAYL
jgi:hypothetical protein